MGVAESSVSRHGGRGPKRLGNAGIVQQVIKLHLFFVYIQVFPIDLLPSIFAGGNTSKPGLYVTPLILILSDPLFQVIAHRGSLLFDASLTRVESTTALIIPLPDVCPAIAVAVLPDSMRRMETRYQNAVVS